MPTTSDVIRTLNGLIQTCKDGQDGYQSAANGITDSTMRKLFLDYSTQRGTFAGQLQVLVQELGGTPETTGSIAASLHRGWINIKAAVTGKDEHKILEECVFGEGSAVNNYRDAVETGLPATVGTVVKAQYDLIRESRDKVRTLKIVTEVPIGS